MAEDKLGGDNLDARIAALQKRIELLEAGAVGTRERVVRDNKPILIDTTRQTIERSKQWMRDLRALEARAAEAAAPGDKARQAARSGGKRAATERVRPAANGA